MIVAIDGPAASGKSTTAKLIAQEFGLLYLDTGAMYRAVALFVKNNGIDLENLHSLEAILEKIDIKFRKVEAETFDSEGFKSTLSIFLNDIDVTEDIRTPEVTRMSSNVATIKIVRQKMVEQQRKLASNHDVILDGRDIGTVVFPDADFKFFLTASLEVRALRRFKEMTQKGLTLNIEEIKNDLIWRDKNDSCRSEAPLKKAEDAIEINTSEMSIEEQVRIIIDIIREKIA
ncbi:MAG: (d)CMP kinase [Candidatus Cloacimonetes bacterium]|nr:(d)CMP kinase [Candidatus Cloacimonadota bacterium]